MQSEINRNELQNMVSLVAIDLLQPDCDIISQMMEQFTTVGFAYIKNFQGWDEQEHFNLVKAFHDMPGEEKEKLKMHHF